MGHFEEIMPSSEGQFKKNVLTAEERNMLLASPLCKLI